MLDPQRPARQANLIGKSHGLSCRYQWDGYKRKWYYYFYRRGIYLGRVSDPERVVGKMEKYATAQRPNAHV